MNQTNSLCHLPTGQYKILLPDCRTQIVDYYVDEYKQYHADVKYEGEICYHEEPKKPHHGYVECIHWCEACGNSIV